MLCTKRKYIVVRNGKLTKRIEYIITQYRELGVNVEFVLEQELEHLKKKALFDEIFESCSNNLVSKIRALEDILSILNS